MGGGVRLNGRKIVYISRMNSNQNAQTPSSSASARARNLIFITEKQ